MFKGRGGNRELERGLPLENEDSLEVSESKPLDNVSSDWDRLAGARKGWSRPRRTFVGAHGAFSGSEIGFLACFTPEVSIFSRYLVQESASRPLGRLISEDVSLELVYPNHLT